MATAVDAELAILQDPTDDRDFLICALDTLSGVLEALGPKTELLLGRSGLRDIILHCCQARQTAPRQPCADTVAPGDVALGCLGQPPLLAPCFGPACAAGWHQGHASGLLSVEKLCKTNPSFIWSPMGLLTDRCAGLQDISPDIRQSAFALVGDLARAACSYLSPALTQVSLGRSWRHRSQGVVRIIT